MQALALGFIKNVVELRNIVFNSFKVEHYTPQDKKKWGKAYHEYLEITGLPL